MRHARIGAAAVEDAVPLASSATHSAQPVHSALAVLAPSAVVTSCLPALRAGGLVLVDGTSGAGKTTLARALAVESGARIVHLDDLYAGWDGLAAATATLERILADRAAGTRPRWRRWDWTAGDWGAEDSLDPAASLIVEGCGSITRATATRADHALWVDGPEPLRRARALARDGDDAWWDGWARQEAAHRARHDPQRWATARVPARR